MECLSADIYISSESPYYFKSSFAKSMAVESKSFSAIDYLRKPCLDSLPQDSTNVKCNNEFSYADNSSHPIVNNRLQLTSRKLSFRCDSNAGKRQTGVKCNQHGNDCDVIALRKECQSLLEENRCLRNTDGGILQSQLDTLHWQLRQTEASRLMYRQVLQQVSKFLDHTHTTLDAMDSAPVSSSRVCRSQSVCSEDLTDTSYTAFRDYTWRRPKKQSTPLTSVHTRDKLSKEAFRLLRTVQSLLNTCEPELAQKQHTTMSRVVEEDMEDIMELGDSFDAASLRNSCRNILRSEYPALNNNQHIYEEPLEVPQPAVSTVSSNEDESGFSSMGSFQEVGLPTQCSPNYRRWNPEVQVQEERLPVLWV